MFKRIPNGFRAGCARPGKTTGRKEIPGKEMKRRHFDSHRVMRHITTYSYSFIFKNGSIRAQENSYWATFPGPNSGRVGPGRWGAQRYLPRKAPLTRMNAL